MSGVKAISDSKFETEVIEATAPVLVYFWATWCGPCRLVSPSIDWAASHYDSRLKVVKMEVDANRTSVKKYKVEGVPGLRLFQNGRVIASHEGAITKQKLMDFLERHLVNE
ncbi:MAG: thioredoxin [Hormoscilla sp. GUM202]|nr:thioredoxin [Hormoscilla sp. GM7CHS1pb]MBO1347367.1 thioredoxin [Hormoscilla sp. GUM202]